MPDVPSQITLLPLYGPVIASTTDMLRRELQTTLQAGQHLLILDVEAVTLLDSLGLALLLEYHRKYRDQGGCLVLCKISDAVKLVLDLTSTSELILSFDSEPAAREYLEEHYS